MELSSYFSIDGDKISFTRQQGSDFAKNIAGDFNPIHNVEAKRFCVPGDLLFAVALNRYGLSNQMEFIFSGMVTNGAVIFPESDENHISIRDEKEKEYLSIKREGETTTSEPLIASLTRSYVEFSGQTFPHILVPLMKQNEVMINPERPLVIYESMSINIEKLDIDNIALELSGSTLEVDGKRGNATLNFNLVSDGEAIGSGAKSMVLSGLRPFEESAINTLVEDYSARKESYLN